MKLYHFAPEHMVESILREGLTKGGLPVYNLVGRLFLIPNHQWLTSNSAWDAQSWATKELIEYDRTDYRLTIKVPKTSCDKLFEARDFLLDRYPGNMQLVDGWPGSEHWYIFTGRIKPGWIRVVERKQVVEAIS